MRTRYLDDMLREHRSARHRKITFSFLAAAFLAVPGLLAGQDRSTSVEEFRQRWQAVVADRESEAEESPVKLEAALSILDTVVLASLNGGQANDPANLNRALKEYAAEHSAESEEYSVEPFAASPGLFVLTANFSLIGPSALRFYARQEGTFRLVSSLTHFTDSRFNDSFIRFVPVPEAWQAVFMSVSGRTDRWRTGTFALWRLSEAGFSLLWLKEDLPLSDYRWQDNRFILDYCAETDEQKASVCLRWAREAYAWQDNRWREVPSP